MGIGGKKGCFWRKMGGCSPSFYRFSVPKYTLFWLLMGVKEKPTLHFTGPAFCYSQTSSFADLF